MDLGRNHDLVAPAEIPDRAAENLLAVAERIPVGRVEEIDAALQRALDERAALLLAEAPGMVTLVAPAVAHAAEANARHVQTGATKVCVFHRVNNLVSNR
jgi:hypothetical protein